MLGIRTCQLNRDFLYPETSVEDDQLRALNHVNLFDADIGSAGDYEAYPASTDAGADLVRRARTYPAVNCAQSHRPDAAPVEPRGGRCGRVALVGNRIDTL